MYKKYDYKIKINLKDKVIRSVIEQNFKISLQKIYKEDKEKSSGEFFDFQL